MAAAGADGGEASAFFFFGPFLPFFFASMLRVGWRTTEAPAGWGWAEAKEEKEMVEAVSSSAGSNPVNVTLTVEGLNVDHSADTSYLGTPPKHASIVAIRNSIRKMTTPCVPARH